MRISIEKPSLFYETAQSVAKVYGFKHINDHLGKYPFRPNKYIRERKCSFLPKDSTSEKYKKILKWLIQNELTINKDNRMVFYHSNVDKLSCESNCLPQGRAKTERANFTLTIVGVQNWLAEFFLMQTGIAIFKELGSSDNVLMLNSMGDTESAIRYEKTLCDYIKRKKKLISPNTLDAFRRGKHMCDYYDKILANETEEFIGKMPIFLRSLSDDSTNHFQSVIEALEGQDVQFEINKHLIGLRGINTHTLFKLKSNKNEGLEASGVRLDAFSESLFNENIPVVSMTIQAPCKRTRNPYIQKKTRTRTPKIFLYHAGINAQVETIKILESLRERKIPVRHRIYISKPTHQMKEDPITNFEYLIKVGQEEIMNSTVIIQKTDTHARKIIPMKNLISFAKSLY